VDAALYTEKLLKRSSLDQMWTVVKLTAVRPIRYYGFGWEIAARADIDSSIMTARGRVQDADFPLRGRQADGSSTRQSRGGRSEKIAEHVAELYLKARQKQALPQQ